MKIIAHRGYWELPSQKNTISAIKNGMIAFDGIETDLRDYKGSIVISHDPAKVSKPTIDDLFSTVGADDKIWALNIKADGISEELIEALHKYNVKNYFAFDMSIPEMFVYRNKNLNFYTSWSDLTPSPLLLNEASGIWLDSFDRIWYRETELKEILNIGLPVCFVSEDLHQRDISLQWELIRKVAKIAKNELMICTDKPNEAKEYFRDDY